MYVGFNIAHDTKCIVKFITKPGIGNIFLKVLLSFEGTVHGNEHDYPSDLRNRHLIPSKSASSSRFRGISRKSKRKPIKSKFCFNRKFKNI